MTQQNINIGTVANDGTGDPLRDAFNKVNSNFTEIATDLATAISSIPTDVSDLTDNNNLLTGGVTVPEDIADLTDVNGLLNTTGDLQINGVSILGAPLNAAGATLTIDTNYDGAMASVNGNGLLVDPTLVGLDQIVSNWTVTFADQTTGVIETSYYWADGDYWVIQLVDNINKDGDMLWPIILKSPDYNAGEPTRLVLSSGNTAPGSAVVINETSVDVNFSGAGTKFKFKPDGTITDGANNPLIGNAVTSVNGQTGNVLLSVLPSTPQELTNGLYASPLTMTATYTDGTGSLHATFTGSVTAQLAIDDETSHAFGRSLHNTNSYFLYTGNNPPFTTNWNMPDWELDRTFVCVELDHTSQVDNGDGTFTLLVLNCKASIPDVFDEFGVPTHWIGMSGDMLRQAINGEDVIKPVYDQAGLLIGTEVAVVGSPEYAANIAAQLINLPTYTKYASIFHLIAGSLADFLNADVIPQ